VASSCICPVTSTGCTPRPLRGVYLCGLNEVNGHAWECIIVLVHLSHSHSRGHKSTQCQRNGVIGAAPYKSIGSLYIINQRCMEITEEREGQKQHTHTHTHSRTHTHTHTYTRTQPDDKHQRSTVRSHFPALNSAHSLIHYVLLQILIRLSEVRTFQHWIKWIENINDYFHVTKSDNFTPFSLP